MERIEGDSISKRVYVEERAVSQSVGRPRKNWIDTMMECLRKRGFMSGKQGEGYRI